MDKLEELAILLLAEGSLRYHNGYEIQFTNTDLALKNYYRKLVLDLGYKPKEKSEKQIVVYSRDLALKLLKLSNSYRTKSEKVNGSKSFPDASFPESAFREPANALRLFFSCEGGVVLSKNGGNEVIVRVCHPKLKEQTKELLSLSEIKFTERGNGLISVKRTESIVKFRDNINFVDGCKAVRGKHKGTEKRVLLENLIRKRPS